MMTEIEAYIRAAAIARNINPDVAVQIAMTEGGVTDPYRQSEIIGPGGRENSVGPFQLFMNGGLGNEALKIGVDPTKDWKRGVDFALDVAAKKKSWADWHGARDNGISNSAGFSETTKPIGITLTSARHVGGAGSGSGSFVDPNVVQVPDMVASSAPAPVTPAPETPAAEEPKGWADKLKSIAEGDDAKALVDNISGKGISGADPKARSSGSDSIPSILPSLEAGDMARMQSAQAMMAQLLASKKRPRGLSLTGVPS
jgi:hypothetical protein